MYRVLLADDEQIERMALARRLMRRFGDILQISEATNGKEAVQLYEKEHSQIIIMDISMPELNGVEAAEKIRSMDEDCIIVFLTAYDEFSYAKRAIVIRALDYLLKPCDEEELTAVMEEAMRLTDKAVENKKNSSGSGEEKTEAEKEAEKKPSWEGTREISLATGRLAFPYLKKMSEEMMSEYPGLQIHVYEVINEFFGELITVSGLLTGQDIVKQLKDKNLGEALYLPRNVLRSGADLFLDDYTLADVEGALQVPVNIVKSSGYDLVDALLGEDTSE